MLQLVQCHTCAKVFNGTLALQKHSCSPQKDSPPQIITSHSMGDEMIIPSSTISQLVTQVATTQPSAPAQHLDQERDSSEMVGHAEDSVSKLIEDVARDESNATLLVDQSGSTIKVLCNQYIVYKFTSKLSAHW